jgi:hypothetical protein
VEGARLKVFAFGGAALLALSALLFLFLGGEGKDGSVAVATAGGEARSSQTDPAVRPTPRPREKSPGSAAERVPERIDPPEAAPTVASGGGAAGPAGSAPDFEEIARRSEMHQAVADVLRELIELRRIDPNKATRLLDEVDLDREKELLDRLRALGPAALQAMEEFCLLAPGRETKVFLVQAIAGMEGPEALAASERIFASTDDAPVKLQVLRSLRQDRDAFETLDRLFASEVSPHVRTELLRQHAQRQAAGCFGSGDGDVLLSAARGDGHAMVRCEAINLVGERGRSEDAQALRDLFEAGEQVEIRKRALLGYALTARGSGLDICANAVTEEQDLGLRAMALLAISRVGELDSSARSRAIYLLDRFAQSVDSQDLRKRAAEYADKLKKNE